MTVWKIDAFEPPGIFKRLVIGNGSKVIIKKVTRTIVQTLRFQMSDGVPTMLPTAKEPLTCNNFIYFGAYTDISSPLQGGPGSNPIRPVTLRRGFGVPPAFHFAC